MTKPQSTRLAVVDGRAVLVDEHGRPVPDRTPIKATAGELAASLLAHWEYYVQLAEYVRLVDLLGVGDLSVGLEDGMMEVSVRREGDLLWCIEVKEKAVSLEGLKAALLRYGPGVPLDEPDRGNDGLRKSKYLVKHRPPFFSILALDAREDYAVRYPAETSFLLDRLTSAAEIERQLADGRGHSLR
jgi:hypothetical protein